MTDMSGDRLPQSELLPSPTAGHAASQLKSPSTKLAQSDHHYCNVNSNTVGLDYATSRTPEADP